MRVPTDKKLGAFAAEMVDRCNASKANRSQRGKYFKGIYLTGSDTGDPATFPYTFAFIDNLSSFLYSPVDLRFMIEQYGMTSAIERAKCHAASSDFHKQIRRGRDDEGLDTVMGEAVTWGLVKGKSFVKLLWTNNGFEPYLIQPEAIGVMDETKGTLDEQDCFVHDTYISLDKLWQMLKTHPKRMEIYERARKYCIKSANDTLPDQDTNLREIAMGGIQPYQAQGNPSSARGMVQWLGAPAPQFAAQVVSNMVPLHELWVWDDERGEYGEWTTIQFVAEDVIITGEITHRNIFAEQYDPKNTAKKTITTDANPLAGKHPFKEICPNPLDGYFWGRSEITNIALLQLSLNKRMDGINRLLRLQEDPPKFFSGAQGIKASAYSLARRPGGYLTDSNPNAKMNDMMPSLPQDLWESMHELERMFDKMCGFTPTMSGMGESGVRSQNHSAALARMASPRFKDRALRVERQIESIGGLALDMLKAHIAEPLTAWVNKAEAGIEGKLPATEIEPPPVPNQVPIDFLYYDLPDNCKIVVDSHSSSPAFSQENEQLLFALAKAGAIDAEQLVRHLPISDVDSVIQELQKKKAQAEEFAKQHPEEAMEQGKKKKKH